MVDFLQGRWPSRKPIPTEITEFCLAKEFSWTLEYIRNLATRDYEVQTMLLNVYYKVKTAENKQKLI